MVDEKCKELYIAGLLHDVGKYIHKTNGNKASHEILSQLFILDNPEICIGADVEKIANIVANHHDRGKYDKSFVGNLKITPDKVVSAELCKKAYDNYKLDCYKSEIDIIKKADSLSASSDRASETGESGNGTSAPYAPLISPIGKVFNKRLAVRHGNSYCVYNFSGDTDTKEVIMELDKNCDEHIESSFESFMNDIKAIKSLNDLDDILKKHWSTVNANTWRPKGESLGNTTTSLYDHSKTTAALAVGAYLNKCAGVAVDDMFVYRVVYNGNNRSLEDIVDNLLNEIGLSQLHVISSTDDEVYAIIPYIKSLEFVEGLSKENIISFKDFGETIDYFVAKHWKFKGCRDSFRDRLGECQYGITKVLGKVDAGIGADTYIADRLDSKFIGGYVIDGYDYILEHVLTENDSISKLSTTFRIFEAFNREVTKLLDNKGKMVLKSELDKTIYSADNIEEVHRIEVEIQSIFEKYFGDATGLYFTYSKYDRYSNTVEMLDREFNTRGASLNIEKKLQNGGLYTTVLIDTKRYKINSLKIYNEYVGYLSKCDKSFLYKAKQMYDELFKYNIDKDPIHLVAKSRLYYMKSKADGNKVNVLNEIYKCAFDSAKGQISDNAYIIYEALKNVLTNVK